MFLMQEQGANGGADDVIELPDDDASVLDLIKYNSRRLYKEYFGTEAKRKRFLDVGCFALACYAIKNYGEALMV